MSDFIQALTQNSSNPILVTGTEVKPGKRALDTYDVLVKETLDQLSTDFSTQYDEIIAQLMSVNTELDNQTVLLESIDQNTANTVGQLLAVNDELNTQTAQLNLIRTAAQSIDSDIDVALSTRATEATQLNVRSELVSVNSTLTDIAGDTESIKNNQTNGTQKSQLFDPATGLSARVVPLGTIPVTGDPALVNKSVIIGKTTAGGGSYVDVKVNPSGALVTDASGSSVTVTSSALPTGAATEATQLNNRTELQAINIELDSQTVILNAINGKLSTPMPVLVQNALVKVPYDQVQITAVNANNDPTTILFKLATVTQKTMTITYDGLGDVSNVVVA